jgi:hypothetical protein
MTLLVMGVSCHEIQWVTIANISKIKDALFGVPLFSAHSSDADSIHNLLFRKLRNSVKTRDIQRKIKN